MKTIIRFTRSILAVAIITGLFTLMSCPAKAAEQTDEQIVRQVFDANYYASQNADVLKAVGGSDVALMRHYIDHGIYEGRSASASFNATDYKNRNADLVAAYGDDMLKYVRHYVTYGKSEGRDATPAKKVQQSTNTTKSNGASYTCIGTYTTKFNSKAARATNINTAVSRINGFVLQPGQEFSYSNTILPRTPENGYVEAPVFINKEHAMGIGGGICQVSSTLYACMKTIGIPATERHPHSLPVDYLPAGWDATVSGTTLDLKFVNTYSKPLMICADSTSTNNRLTVSLWLQD